MEDLVKAVLLVWNAPATAQRFYTVCGELLTMRQVADVAARIFPHVHVTFEDSKTVSSPYAAAFDDSHLRNEFGYRPEFTIEKAIRAYAASEGAEVSRSLP